MKKIIPNFRSYVLLSIVALTLIFISCRKEDESVNPNNDNNSNKFGNINGKVVTTGGIGISGIAVSVGNVKAYTDEKGGFFLSKVPVGNRVLVNFTNDNYASTQKIVTVKENRTSDLDAAMMPVGKKQIINTPNGASVQFNNAKVDIPANTLIDSHGNPFTGPSQINATFFDPANDAFLGCFPGEFMGTRTDNSETQIESFGFINVEIFNGTEKLQIASGKQATITLPISAKLQAKAPNTIQLWYYDEAKGKWIEEGVAIKTGNNYVGTVKHFSNWNCDQPTQTSYLSGKVVDKNGDPLSFVTVKSAGVDYTGQSTTTTADDGTFKLAVKSNATASVVAKYHIFSSTSADFNTPATGDVQDIGTLTINVDTMNVVIIVGRIVDNLNSPISGVYLKLLDSTNKIIDLINTNKDGNFKLFGEINSSYVIEVQNYANDSTTGKAKFNLTTGSQYETKDMGDLKIDVGGSFVTGRTVDSLNNPLPNVYFYSLEGSYPPDSRGNRTDSTGNFLFSARPNKTFDIHFYGTGQSKTKTVTVTSGSLGETKDIGDVQLK